MDLKKIKLFYLLPIGIVTLYTFYLLYNFEKIPNIVPIYGYGDNAKFGKKIFMFFPVLLNYLILIFIWFLIKNPRKLNLSVKIDDNKYKEGFYVKIQIALIVLSTIFSIIFCLLFIDIFSN